MNDIDEDELDEAGIADEDGSIDESATEEIEQTEDLEQSEAVVAEEESEGDGGESESDVEVVVETQSYSGSDAFVVFVRHENQVLLLKRADGVADFPGAWDGVYGIGDPTDIDAITTRVEEATGISAANLTHVRSASARGLEFGNRLNDVTPVLFMSATTEVEPRTLYKGSEWVDSGYVSTNVPDEDAISSGSTRYTLSLIHISEPTRPY